MRLPTPQVAVEFLRLELMLAVVREAVPPALAQEGQRRVEPARPRRVEQREAFW
jgi:hypothetical protein